MANGCSDIFEDDFDCGGGLFVDGARLLTLTNVTLTQNTAENLGLGGGIFDRGSSLVFTNVTFNGNSSAGIGGGMFNWDNSSALLTNVTFSENTSVDSGAGISTGSNSSLTLKNVTFSENSTTVGSGGGLSANGGTHTLTDVTFSANFSGNTTNFGGGGMFLASTGSSTTLNNVIFSGNVSAGAGGGLAITDSSPSLTNVHFSKNTAEESGGGMANLGGSPTLTNVVFSGNSALGTDELINGGGGMGNALGASPTLTNVTFSGNEASVWGGGMMNVIGSSVTLTNTIVWGNSAGQDGNEIYNDSGTGTSIQLHYSLYANEPGDIVEGDEFTAENSLTDDPLFVDAENGNLRLAADSPAIDAGDPDTDLGIFPTDENGDPVDLDGNPRVFRDQIDIGAYENQGMMPEPELAFDPTSLDFGDVEVGTTSVPRTATLQNTGSGDATGLTFGPTGGGFEADTSACDDTLPAGASCEVSVTFTPAEPGAASAVLEVTSDQDASAGLGLSGTGVSGGPVTIRYVDGDTGLDTGDCTNEANPCATIGYALDQADAGNTIAIADAEYTESFEIDKDLTLQGESEAGTIIQAHENPGEAESRVITIDGDLEVEIVNVTIRHGVADGCTDVWAPNVDCGGALFNVGAALTVTNVTFNENEAEGVAGAMYNENSSPSLTNVTFSGNSASLGGGMHNQDSSSPLLMNVTFSENTAGNSGGGMSNITNITGSPSLTNVTFNGNTALANGGGMYIFNSGSSTKLTNVTFSGNEAGDMGGGMHNQDNSSPSLTNVTFSENTAGNSGGGMSNINGSPTLTNVNFIGNEAGDWAGGMGNGLNSHPTLTNVTFSGNEAGLLGGGIYNVLNSSATLVNTILWGNTANMGNEIFNDDIGGGAGSTLVRYSLYSDGPGDIEGPGHFEAENSVTDDPLFADAENGDLRLLEGSPAIDAGDPDTDPFIFPTDENGDPIDLDGNPRFFGDAIDIGAYENHRSMPEPELTFDPTSLDFGDVAVGDISLPQTATLHNTGSGDATGLTFGPTGGGFESDTSACGDTLPAGASCPISVTFSPGEPGEAGATLQVDSDEGASAAAELSGNGIGDGGFTAMALQVDHGELLSDGNGVFEPGETVDVAPAWRSDGTVAVSLAGTASDLTGPQGPDYTTQAPDADHGLLEPDQTASCLDTEVCYQMGVDDTAVRPATHWEATFVETLDDTDGTSKTWVLHIGESFTDVPTTNTFYPSIETLLHSGVTGGCSGSEYCPGDPNSRAQMPVFMLRALMGPDYAPPECVEGDEVFDDVPATSTFCPWIQDLANRGIVAGCGDDNYCPTNPVSRAQMAIFLLKTLEGDSYTPPECTGEFTDVLCPSLFADWIEDLAAREITGGCTATTYCPGDPVSRAQMAVFITKAFGFTLYGP